MMNMKPATNKEQQKAINKVLDNKTTFDSDTMQEEKQNTETKKQEAIRLAYGEYWGNLIEQAKQCALKNDGWISSILQHAPKELELDFGNYQYRPKSLSGIEDNNGWISILSEEDLPKEKISYEVWRNGSESRATYAGSDRWFVPHNDFPKTTKVAGITHYAEPIKRQPPIF